MARLPQHLTPSTRIYWLLQKMPALPVLNLDEPEVGVGPRALGDVFVHVGLALAQRPGRKIEPDALALAIPRWRIEPGAAVERRHLHQHRAGVLVALAPYGGEGAGDRGAADQGAGPDFSLQFEHAGPEAFMRSPERNPLSLTLSGSMRLLFLATAISAALAGVASATEGPDAREAYVERRGLIETDARCHLFPADLRAALNVGAMQARGSLLRAGWTSAQLHTLEQTVAQAAAQRACNDARTLQSADNARRAFAPWLAAGYMEFPGWERAWLARRGTSDGWRLSQAIEAPRAAVFGVRQQGAAQRLALVITLERNETAPISAQLILRDASRTALREISLTQRVAYGIQAGAPSPSGAMTIPSARAIERVSGGRSQAVFTFPDNAFATLLQLDPRESIELRVQSGRAVQSMYVEVGDIAAARAFLTIR